MPIQRSRTPDEDPESLLRPTVGGRPDLDPTIPPVAPAPRTHLPRAFGPYTVLREIGSGGMGAVYEAVHEQRNRREALKVLKGRLGTDATILARFEREVRVLSGVEHPHVVTLYDSGNVDGELYYTMPLLPGPSLAEILGEIKETGETVPGKKALAVLDGHGIPVAGAPTDPPEVRYARRIASAFVGVADALSFMHEAGFLHRDVKPGNLLFDASHRLRLTDFGLVRTPDKKITQTGQTLGTPAYMSPEQIIRRHDELDGRTDVYSLGATLFEALTLRQVHEGDSLGETMRLILGRRARSIRALNPALPADLATIISRCLEARPADRYPDAAALRDDLTHFVQGAAVGTRPLSPWKRFAYHVGRNRLPYAIGVLAAVGLLAYALLTARDTTLAVRSVAAARVTLDGKEWATLPMSPLEVGAGRHNVEVTHPLFEPTSTDAAVEAGERVAVLLVPKPHDPANPEALRLLAQLTGTSLNEERVEKARGGVGHEPRVLWPRGVLRRAPTSISLGGEVLDPGWQLRVRTEAADAEPALSRDLEPFARGAEIDLSETERAALVAPGRWTVEVVEPLGDVRAGGTYVVLAPSAQASVEQALARITDNLAPDSPAARMLGSQVLLEHDLLTEAFASLQGLRAELGDRKEVLRLGLITLTHAGLDDSATFAHWVQAWQAAKD